MRGMLQVVVVAMVGFTGGALRAQDPAAEARAALDAYLVAWNAGDNEAVAESSNFPRLSLGTDGQVVMRDGPDEIATDFSLLRQAEGWDHTTLDLIDPVHVSDDKVHFNVVVSRRRADGTAYRTAPALYIVTRQGQHWGLQLQSILPPTFTGP